MEQALHLWDPMPSLVDAVRIDQVTGHAVGVKLGSLLGLFLGRLVQGRDTGRLRCVPVGPLTLQECQGK